MMLILIISRMQTIMKNNLTTKKLKPVTIKK